MTRHHDGQSAQGTVLVAEADADTRLLYRHLLEPFGFAIAEAADGREAMTSALVSPPALILMELVLTYVDGIALCRILRQDGATRQVPIVVATAESRPAVLSEVRLAGADVVLTKPVMTDHLLSEILRLHNLDDSVPVQSTPPPVRCPVCDRPLYHRSTHVGGLDVAEQWDYYHCAFCARSFQYRHRTRKLRPSG
jgi:CheY-like chemotaxis protein